MTESEEEREFRRLVALTEEYAPKILAPSWRRVLIPSDSPFYGQAHYLKDDGLHVIFTADDAHSEPGKTWLHVSFARQDRIPGYLDMLEVKGLFVGAKRQALQILPPEDKHLNIHPHALHLWSCIEGDGLPDFGRFGSI